MATVGKHILKNCRCWLNGYDMSGDLSQMALTSTPKNPELNLFGPSSSVRRMAGLWNTVADHQGLWDTAETGGLDKTLYDEIGVSEGVMSVAPLTGAAGETAFTFVSTVGQYNPGGRHGDLFGFSVHAEGGNLIRGTVMVNGNLTATGTGTDMELGPVAEGQQLYAAMHVLSASGTNPTLDMVVQSLAFGIATERLAFPKAIEPGGWWATPVAGPITDEWWRVSYTIGGTATPKFLAVVILGIQA